MDFQRCSVLLISRNRILREAMQLRLEQQGFKTFSCADCQIINEVTESVEICFLDSQLATPEGVSSVHQKITKGKLIVFGLSISASGLRPFVGLGIHGYLDSEADISEWMECLSETLGGVINPRVGAVLNELLQSQSLSAKSTTVAPKRSSARDDTVDSEVHNYELTQRQLEIMQLIKFDGLNNKEIARRLGVEVSTIKNHVHEILRKLRVHTRSKAAAKIHLVKTTKTG